MTPDELPNESVAGEEDPGSSLDLLPSGGPQRLPVPPHEEDEDADPVGASNDEGDDVGQVPQR